SLPLPLLSLYRARHHRHLHSFPTRRSSDLPQAHVTVPAVQLRLGRLPAAPEQRPLNPLLRWMFLLLVFSIPFEYPDRSFPIEIRSEEHTSELQSRGHLVCRLLLEKKKK